MGRCMLGFIAKEKLEYGQEKSELCKPVPLERVEKEKEAHKKPIDADGKRCTGADKGKGGVHFYH